MGYEKTGGSIQTNLKDLVKNLNINTEHFLG